MLATEQDGERGGAVIYRTKGKENKEAKK